MAGSNAFPDSVLLAVLVVPATLSPFVDPRDRDSAEPLQHWSTGGDALGAIFVDYQSLRASRGGRRGLRHPGPEVASAGLFRRPDCRWDRAVCPRALAGKPRLPSRFHHQLLDLYRAGEHSSLHPRRCDLEVARWTDRFLAAEFTRTLLRGSRRSRWTRCRDLAMANG